ncbi:hypothetical protein KIP88_02945 [Bradyrhizobium sp. SRL28]|uniref:hypothetical protein n=1 Tax=Bradyrhizobium sp. SRL28 TaxID=2836178 RepID=UPI001BDDD506|nr:hypothetical protein [Bradyrhizobium sp. SRL28]MBT1509449.1 hypothetical protein [Bradyrhizobium sp. SRL28]
MRQPTLAVIIPIGGDVGSLPGFGGGWGSGPRPDQGLPGSPGRPDNSLPWAPGHPGGGPIYPDYLPGWGGGWGSGAVDPGYGRPIFHPGHPDHGLPVQPGHPGNRPPGSGGGHPDQGLPWAPVRPDQGLPGEQPGIDNSLPGGGWTRPDQGLPPHAQPKVYAAAVPPTPPTSVNTEEGAWVIVNVNGVLAWAWAQKPPAKPGIDNTLPGGAPTRPDNTLPETPEPK